MLKKQVLTGCSVDWGLTVLKALYIQLLLPTWQWHELAVIVQVTLLLPFAEQSTGLAQSLLHCLLQGDEMLGVCQPARINLSLDITLVGSFWCRLKRKMTVMLVRGIFICQPSCWTLCTSSKGCRQKPSVQASGNPSPLCSLLLTQHPFWEVKQGSVPLAPSNLEWEPRSQSSCQLLPIYGAEGKGFMAS